MALAQELTQTRFVMLQVCIFPFCFKEGKSNNSWYCHEAASLKHGGVETSVSLTMLIQACWTNGLFLQSKAYEIHCSGLNIVKSNMGKSLVKSREVLSTLGVQDYCLKNYGSSSLKTLADALLFFTSFSSLFFWDHCGSWMTICSVYDWERLKLSNGAAKTDWVPVAVQVGSSAYARAWPAHRICLYHQLHAQACCFMVNF